MWLEGEDEEGREDWKGKSKKKKILPLNMMFSVVVELDRKGNKFVTLILNEFRSVYLNVCVPSF